MKTVGALLLVLLCSGCGMTEAQWKALGWDLMIINSIPLSQAETGCKLT